MKASQFNSLADYENDMLLYNSLSHAFVKLDRDSYDMYLKITSQDSEKTLDESDPLISAAIADFKRGGFIVNNELNEVDLLRVNQLFRRFPENNLLDITIAPTSDCNFNCIYCYENYKKPDYMSREVEDTIIKYVDKHLKPDSGLVVTWFGGEPLMGLETIYRLSEEFIKIAEKKKSIYSSTIVTNGYLLNQEVVTNLKKCKIEGAQITLDGAPEYHDQVRCHKDGSGTFDTILKNIQEIEKDFMIVIRVNVGRNNLDSFVPLLDKLEEYGVINRVAVSVAELEAREYSCDEVKEAMLTPEEFSKVYVKFIETIIKRGINARVIPRSHALNCASISRNGFLIGPDGKMYKCWDLIGSPTECIGKIGEPVPLTDGSLKWLAWDVFKNEECCSCNILPLCMGGCPRKSIVKDEILNSMDSCFPAKYVMDDLLKILYRQQLMAKNAW